MHADTAGSANAWQDYYLATHVHVCRAGRQVIMLDLQSGRYFALGNRMASAIGAVVPGWPIPAGPVDARGPIDAHCRSLIGQLVEKGLLTGDAARGKTACPVDIERPVRALVEEDAEALPRIDARILPGFLTAIVAAAAKLRVRSIAHIVDAAWRQKSVRNGLRSEFDLGSARELVQSFESLRPMFFARKDACLFHSLALLEFLARRDLFPMWVFGVRTDPFRAHCWLQERDVVINDVPERVMVYTPILRI